MGDMANYTLDVFDDYMDEYLDFEYDAPISYKQRKANQDRWYYHEWFKLVMFHKEFEKSILVTLADCDDEIYTKLIPKSIIGKRETILTYSTREEEIRFLIHMPIFDQLATAAVFYLTKYDEAKFIEKVSDTQIKLQRETQLGIINYVEHPSDLKYSHWHKEV